MTNTSLPPNPDDSEVLRSLDQHLQEANTNWPIEERLRRDGNRALIGLKESFVKFISPMARLQTSIQRMDETNRKITQMGTTYTKLEKSLAKNSDVLNQNNVSNRALITELAKNSEQGVRIFGGAVTDLTKEMIATGQNLGGLRTLNSNLVLQTGNNVDAIQQLNKTNKDVSDKYGVSNDRLIESLNSLKGAMDKASFFGPQAVGSFGDIAQQLKGMAGGASIEGALKTLFGVLTPGLDNIAAGHLLGAGGIRQKIAVGGDLTMADVRDVLSNLKNITDTSTGRFGETIAASRAGLGGPQMIQLMQLNNIMESNFKLSKEEQATEKEKFNNIKNLQDKQNDWYDNGAVQMLDVLGMINTNTLIQAGQAASILGVKAFDQRGGRGGQRGRPDQGGRPPTALGPSWMGTGTTPGSSGDRRPTGRMTGGALGRVTGAGMRGLGGGTALAAGALALGGGMGFDTKFTAGGAMLGSVMPGIGTGIGTLVGLGLDSVMYLKNQSENSTELLKQEKEKANKERSEGYGKDIQRINFLTAYLRSRAGASLMEDDESKLMLGQLVSFAKKADDKMVSVSARNAVSIR